MKRKWMIIILLMFLYTNVYAFSSWRSNSKNLIFTSTNIEEEVIPTFDQNNDLFQLNIIITIPKNYNKKIITISPSVFDSVKAYKNLSSGDMIKINLKVKNLSNNDYKYVSNSFVISTINPTKLGIKDNFVDTGGVGFDNNIIYDIQSPTRCCNEAILALYNYKSDDEINGNDMQDENLNKVLGKIGYTGIEQLDKYFLDFYNNKYNLTEVLLEDFPNDIIGEIFSGKEFYVIETNKVLIELAYNFYYNKLLSFGFSEDIITDYNNDYSIGSYMRKIDDNKYIKDAFSLIKSRDYKQINNMHLTLNSTYTANSFVNYNYYVHFQFKLQKKR